MVRISALCILTITMTLSCPNSRDTRGDLTEMAKAAAAFLESLPKELQSRAQLPSDARSRGVWGFVPGERPGLPLKAMPKMSRRAARALLSASLTTSGRLKAEAIMGLEQVLFDQESRPDQPAIWRDAELYYFVIYGDPTKPDWSWRIEGHHLSLRFCVREGHLVDSAPAFLGSNPAVIQAGPRAGEAVLLEEESWARRLALSLTEEQREAAIIGTTIPRDILYGPAMEKPQLKEEGLSWAQLDDRQKAQLKKLIYHYVENMAGHRSAARKAEVEKDLPQSRFCWIGSMERYKPHYYRISAPTFIIEYDNIQNGANHIHAVLRDPRSEFGNPIRDHRDQKHR